MNRIKRSEREKKQNNPNLCFACRAEAFAKAGVFLLSCFRDDLFFV